MIEQLKTIAVSLLLLFVAFGVGVLVGLKLPENEAYKRWIGAHKVMVEKAKPTEVAVMQMPGSAMSRSDQGKAGLPLSESHPDSCPGGVCKLPTLNEAPHQPEEPHEKQLNLTFYKELSDRPTESGGAAIRIKTAPPVEKKKTASVVMQSEKRLPKTVGSWELRICSLAQEIKARLVRSQLMKTYPGIEIEEVQVAGKGTWYRVKISNIKDREVAERYQRELTKAHKYQPLIVKR